MPNGHHYADSTREDDQASVLTRGQNSGEPDTELVSSRVPRMDPALVTNQSGNALDDDDEKETDDEYDEEPTDEDDDPTGEHDHHQDDNYSLGGHVTRSSE